MADLVIDARGRACPVPVIELARAIRNAAAGAVVRLLADDPAAERDLAAWCDATGHALLALHREGEAIAAWVEKRSDRSLKK